MSRSAAACDAVGESLTSSQPGRRQLEFHAHAHAQWLGAWRRVPAPLRKRLTDELAETVIAQASNTIDRSGCSSVALHRPIHTDIRSSLSAPTKSSFARANGFLGRRANAGDLHRCIAISDKTREKCDLQPLMRNWQAGGGTTGANIRPLASYAEVPLFVDSDASRWCSWPTLWRTGCIGRTSMGTRRCLTDCCRPLTRKATPFTGWCIWCATIGPVSARLAGRGGAEVCGLGLESGA